MPVSVTLPVTTAPAPPRSNSARCPGWRSNGTLGPERKPSSSHGPRETQTLTEPGGTRGNSKRPSASVTVCIIASMRGRPRPSRRIGCSTTVAPLIGLPPSLNWPRTAAHGCSRNFPASCWPAGNSADANPASDWTITAHGSPGSGNAKRPAASVDVWWLPRPPGNGDWFRRGCQHHLCLGHGLAFGVEYHASEGLARLKAEILRAGGVVTETELRPVLRAISLRPRPAAAADSRCASPQNLSRPSLPALALPRSASRNPCGTHDRNDGKLRDGLACRRIGHAACDRVRPSASPCARHRRRVPALRKRNPSTRRQFHRRRQAPRSIPTRRPRRLGGGFWCRAPWAGRG